MKNSPAPYLDTISSLCRITCPEYRDDTLLPVSPMSMPCCVVQALGISGAWRHRLVWCLPGTFRRSETMLPLRSRHSRLALVGWFL